MVSGEKYFFDLETSNRNRKQKNQYLQKSDKLTKSVY